jgi:hypothetical protein
MGSVRRVKKPSVGLKVERELEERLDAIAEQRSLRGEPATRSDVLRAVIEAGLPREERRLAQPTGAVPKATAPEPTTVATATALAKPRGAPGGGRRAKQ